MNTNANTARFAGCRWLASLCSLLILLAGLAPTHAGRVLIANGAHAGATLIANGAHAGTMVVAGGSGVVEVFAPRFGSDGQLNPPHGTQGHIAGQCSCGMSVLPQSAEQPVSLLVRPVRFVMTAPPFLPSSAQAPPAEPPRT